MGMGLARGCGIGLFGVFALWTANAHAADACRLVELASLDLDTDPGHSLAIPASIDGHDIKMLVDTGSVYSMLADKTVTDLGLRRQSMRGGSLEMFGGEKLRDFTNAANVKFGNMVADTMVFIVMPDGKLATANGTLGPDILHSYDIEFDFGNNKFNIFKPNTCGDVPVYWTHGVWAEVPMRVDSSWHIRMPVVLNGKNVIAEVDTGSSVSVLSRSVMHDVFEIDANGPPPAFTTLSFAGVEVGNPDIYVPPASTQVSDLVDHLILGRSILRRLRFYISYKDQKIYLSAADAH